MLHMKADQITTHPQVETNTDGEQIFTVSGPVFGLNGNQVARATVLVRVPPTTKITASYMREFALQLFNVKSGTVRRE